MITSDLAASLRHARRAAGLSQGELARRAGVSRMTVTQMETGAKDPRVSTVVVLLRALGLELMPVPSAIRTTVLEFVRSGGRVVGQAAGTAAPPSIVDAITRPARRTRG